jgi:protein TonB
MSLRIASWLVSAALHSLVAAFFLVSIGSAALESLEAGDGEDTFTIEQGIGIEGIAKLGDADVVAEAVEVEPQEMSEARPQIDEVKVKEEIEENEILTSKEGPVQEEVPEIKPEPVEQPRPPQVATLEQVEQVKVEEQQRSGKAQTAGKASERSQYLGKLRYHLEGKKVNPRSQQSGLVVVKFVVDMQGAIVSREVTTSSGSDVLDKAAIASIDRAAPFPPMPADLGEEKIVVSVPFRFTVR